jgi:curved DNA-binding protein CbpA
VRSGDRDPHRVLGVAHDASEGEIKRAYRALAKRHHPDGEQGSVTRFLELQAAYEALMGGGRPAAPAGPSGRRGTPPRPGAAWVRRPRPAGTRSSNPGTATGSTPNAGRPRPAADPTRPRRASGRRRASLGSTSYDDAEEVFEPGWGGASWYGPSSGTYWTLNPREYADPRKHGPEYQARARRPAATGPSTEAAGTAGRSPTDTTPGARAAPAPPGPVAPARPSILARVLRAWRRGTIRA